MKVKKRGDVELIGFGYGFYGGIAHFSPYLPVMLTMS